MHERARVIATVLAGFEEIAGSEIKSETYYHMVCRQLGHIGESTESKAMFEEWRRAALCLADARTNELGRTTLSIALYVFGVFSILVDDSGGGNTTRLGERLGSTIFMSWLVPLALLSNTVGTFTSRRTCLTIMRLFVDRVMSPDQPALEADQETKGRGDRQPASVWPVTMEDINPSTRRASIGPHIPPDMDSTFSPLIKVTTWTTYFQSLQWLGAIYTYRPWKFNYLGIHRTHVHGTVAAMFVCGLIPMVVSMFSAFYVFWFTMPKGFSCQHLWLINIFLAWIISAAFTSLMHISFRKILSGRQLWLVVLVKDCVIGIAALLVIFMSTAGIFNSCYCWTKYVSRGEQAYVPLNTDETYNHHALRLYSIIVGVCIGTQIAFYVVFMIWWRHGLSLIVWTEARRRKEWAHEMTDEVRYGRGDYLLFWYRSESLESEEMMRQRRDELQQRRPSRWLD